MRRPLLSCLAIAFALACGDDYTEPTSSRTTAVAARPLFATTTTEDGLSISTDKDDYQPGDVVHLTGSGWEPGDVLDIVLTDDPMTHDPHRWTVTVGEDGTFADDTYVVDEGDVNVAFTLVATSRATGRSLTVNFTDNVLQTSVTVDNQSSVSVLPGASISLAVTARITSQSPAPTNWKSTGWVLLAAPSGQPAGKLANCVNTDDVAGSGGQGTTGTRTFSITAPVDPATYDLWVAFSDVDGTGSTACGGGGTTATIKFAQTVTVQGPANVAPVVDAGGPYSGNRNVAMSLGGATATDGDGDALTYAWIYAPVSGVPAGTTCSFSSATVLNPSFTCTNVGTFKVTLSVDDAQGHTVSDDAQVTVSNGAPTAVAGADYEGAEGSPVELDGSGSDPDGDALTYKWTYAAQPGVDAGATCSFDDDTKKDARVTCSDDGTFKLTLTVTDPDALTNADDALLVLTNANPNASAGGPYTGFEGSPVSLNGSVTDAGSNDTHTWAWQYVAGAGVDAGATCTINNPSAEDPTITCTDDGTVKLTLTVTDDDGDADTDEATLTLANADPVANAGGPYSGNEGAGVSLTGTKSDAGSNDTQTYAWTYAAGAGVDAGATCVISSANALSASINCTDDGTYQVTLTVSDDDGGVGTQTANVTVANVRPNIAAGLTKRDAAGSALPVTVFLNGTVNFRAAFTDPGSNDTHSAQVNCTGTPSTSSANVSSPYDASCTFSSIGLKVITLTITDDDGGSHVVTHSLTVQYNFSGFTAPVDRPNTMNVSKAGQTIPLKWRLTDALGRPVTNLTSVVVQTVGLPCGTYSGTDVLEEYAAGSSGLRNLGDGYYRFNWKTPVGYAGTCKSITLTFGAGGGYTEKPSAYFTFKR